MAQRKTQKHLAARDAAAASQSEVLIYEDQNESIKRLFEAAQQPQQGERRFQRHPHKQLPSSFFTQKVRTPP